MIDGMPLVGVEQYVPKLALKLRLAVAIMLNEGFDHGEFILCTFDTASRSQDFMLLQNTPPPSGQRNNLPKRFHSILLHQMTGLCPPDIVNLRNLCILGTMYKILFYPVLTLLLFVGSATAAPAANGLRTAAVAMPDRYGAEASIEILEQGGNAVDAAIAATFALAVTYPEAGNIGGGGFLVAHINGKSVFLDFREKAPLAAHRDMYLDEKGDFVQARSLVGALAVGVPGTVKGMQLAHQRFGSLAWQQLLQPAIRLARDGFVVHEELAALRDGSWDKFSGETNFAHYFETMDAGATFRQPELAKTLQRIAADPDDFYRGKIAAQIVTHMKKHGGLIDARDLREYTAVWREPLIAPWRGHQVVSTPPPSSGGIALTQLLTMRDAASQYFRGVEHNSAAYIHLLAEIEKRVFADRGDYLGDPDFGDVPVAELTDPAYLRRRAMEINPEAISTAEKVQPGLESIDTTHFSVMDGDGNAVSLTYTQNWEFGSGVVVEGAGFLLNNEMDDFSAKVGVPNAFGVIGKSMNAIEPGKRMLSSMTPTIILRGGKPVIVVGTPGGSTIFTSVFQVILNLFDYDMTATDAVAATRFHHQLPASTIIRYDGDRDINPELRRKLEQFGYELQPNWWGSIGDVQLIVRQEDGALEAAADPRGRGVAKVLALPESGGHRAP
jgi:gamma-glutamyltranspeptidase/glutathione hydrolase